MVDNRVIKYNYTFPASYSSLDIEVWCFNHAKPEDKPLHFKNIVAAYWGPRSRKPFAWNPWNEKMLKFACAYKFLSLSGSASSGKTTFLAMWGLVNWLCNPETTKVLCTSTTLKDSRRRIWGKIEDYFEAAGRDDDGNSVLPGKLASSFGIIRSLDRDGHEMSPLSGIELIAGDSAKERENIGKIIGVHNEHVIFLCDEMPELSPALTEAAQSNLAVNPHFQMISSGNFASVYDPFGIKSTPKGGWGTVDENVDEWETEDGGYCLRFDALKSPNILAGKIVHKGIYGPKDLEEHKRTLGEHSAGFWRMCRSFPCQDADTDRIYSEADFVKGDVHSPTKWSYPPIAVASLDPAFATGGDRAIAFFGELGVSSVTGLMTLYVREKKEYREDVRIKDQNRATQVAKQWAADCIQKQISPQHAAYDASGGGIPFGSLVAEIWSPMVVGVQFGGAPSTFPVSAKDRRPAKEGFANRIAEIWFAGVDYVLSGQIKGLPLDTAKELAERRRIREQKGITGLKLRVESKSDMKERIGRSCDEADSFLILVCLAREKLGFLPVGLEMKQSGMQSSWKEKAHKVNSFYSKAQYAEEAA